MSEGAHAAGETRSVALVQEWVPSYRVPFFERLRAELGARGIELRLLHGPPPQSRRARNDATSMPWAEPVSNRTIRLGGSEITWQPILRSIRDAELVVVPQAITLPAGMAATLLSAVPFGGLGFPPVVVWGHGENIEASRSVAFTERIKRWITRRADWFLAYTARSADIVASSGFPRDRITTVNNTRDPAVLVEGPVSAEVAQLVETIQQRSKNVGWMISALDRSKRLETLIETLDAVRLEVPDFEFVVVGAGSQEGIVRDAAKTRDWLHVMGARFGADRSALGAAAIVTVHPGLIGLHVIDSFGFRAPIVTAEMPDHSHEVSYLDDGFNARVLSEGATSADLASAVAELLRDRSQLERLSEGCAVSAGRYGLDAMVDRFANGIEQALAS